MKLAAANLCKFGEITRRQKERAREKKVGATGDRRPSALVHVFEDNVCSYSGGQHPRGASLDFAIIISTCLLPDAYFIIIIDIIIIFTSAILYNAGHCYYFYDSIIVAPFLDNN